MSWACIIKKLEVLEQISGHKVQLKSKSHKKRTSVSIMFQLPPQIVLGCSNSKWYLNLVFHPLNTSCKNQEPTRHEHNVTAFYTKLYWFHHGRSLPRTFSPLTFSITEPSQLHSSFVSIMLRIYSYVWPVIRCTVSLFPLARLPDLRGLESILVSGHLSRCCMG